MTEQLKRVAENAWVILVARLMSVFGPPIALALVTYVAVQLIELREGQVKMQTALLVGIEPRLSRVEADQVALREDLDGLIRLGFQRTDAAKLEADLRRDIERLEQGLREIRTVVGGL
jgi:hypothetical protein